METETSYPEVINGVGTDIIEVRRIKEAIERHGDRFINRLFTEKERLYCRRYQDSIPRFAGRFAAKEAVLKALGTGLKPDIGWQEIEILNDRQGKPEVHLSARLKRTFPFTHLFVSISHCQEYATATAILVGVMNGAS
ncbi:MAG: holo-ACP synthase [Chlamydiales bacterium]|nr:holo-ACP synthase [Chlamydiales bacterium]